MNPALSEILKSGLTVQSIPEDEGAFLQALVRQADPTVSLEVGLAYGISALFICDALNVRSGTQHTVIDPFQYSNWKGAGIRNLERAGYGDIVTLIEEPSCLALPALERSGKRIDFAFIDGWHMFDFALVDFFFVDRLLKVGGVVAFDDAGWPAIRKVCRFIRTNLAYSVAGAHPRDWKRSLRRRTAERLLSRKCLRKIVRPELAVPDLELGLTGRCIAFRKENEDNRRWNHFNDF